MKKNRLFIGAIASLIAFTFGLLGANITNVKQFLFFSMVILMLDLVWYILSWIFNLEKVSKPRIKNLLRCLVLPLLLIFSYKRTIASTKRSNVNTVWSWIFLDLSELVMRLMYLF